MNTATSATETASLQRHVVSHKEWLAAQKQHLEKEKALTHLRDQLSAERRELPWEKIEKSYLFQGPNGTQTLGDLFAGRSQLIVYHFMFAPGWSEGCSGCSFMADHFDGANLHLAHHDVTLMAVSRAPWQELAAFKKRMNWDFTWMSSYDSDFNYDFQVSVSADDQAKGEYFYNFAQQKGEGGESPGLSVFYRDENGEIYHTYSAYARGGDILLNTYNFLDMTPKGRNESTIMDWLRHHDKYDAFTQHSCCH